VLESIGVHPNSEPDAIRRLKVLRAIDKLDRLGAKGVRELLGEGRKDESGDFARGADLDPESVETVLLFLQHAQFFEPTAYPTTAGAGLYGRTALANYDWTLARWEEIVGRNDIGRSGINELREMAKLFGEAEYRDRIDITAEVVRGLEYYTGPVFEAEITVPVVNEDGQAVRFGSVGGGGRYDDLVARFTGQKVPATGFSIGVSRLQAALAALGKSGATATDGPVVVLVLDKAELPLYQNLTQKLRRSGIRAEMYLGTAGMKAQMKYADRRGAPCVVIQGSDERAKGEVQIKDLVEGARAAATIKDSREWREGRPAQISVPEARLVEAVHEVLARHKG
jgi:histidyl-tRNA synthetase